MCCAFFHRSLFFPSPKAPKVQGERKKMIVKRFSVERKKKVAVPAPVIKKGKGEKLQDLLHGIFLFMLAFLLLLGLIIFLVEAQIKKRFIRDDALVLLHRLVLGKVDKHTTLKDNLRAFSGITFEDEAARDNLENRLLNKHQQRLRDLAHLLNLDASGSRDEIVATIMKFLEKPYDSGLSPRKRSHSKISKVRIENFPSNFNSPRRKRIKRIKLRGLLLPLSFFARLSAPRW